MSPERLILGGCLPDLDEVGALQLKEIAEKVNNWDQVCGVIENQDLGGTFWYHVLQGRWSPPSEAASRLKKLAHSQLALGVLYEEEWRRFSKAATQSGVRVVLWKGLAAAESYPHPMCRGFHDLDMLVEEGEARWAHEYWLSRGYHLTDHQSGVTAWTHSTGLTTEVHTHLVPQSQCREAYRVPMSQVWASVVLGEVGHRLSPEWTYLSYVLHAGLRHGFRGVKWLVDLHQLNVSLSKVEPMASEVGCSRMAGMADWLVREGLGGIGTKPDGVVRRALNRNLQVSCRMGMERRAVDEWIQEGIEVAAPWLLADSWKDRVAMLQSVPLSPGGRGRGEGGNARWLRIAAQASVGLVAASWYAMMTPEDDPRS